MVWHRSFPKTEMVELTHRAMKPFNQSSNDK